MFYEYGMCTQLYKYNVALTMDIILQIVYIWNR